MTPELRAQFEARQAAQDAAVAAEAEAHAKYEAMNSPEAKARRQAQFIADRDAKLPPGSRIPKK